MKKKEIAKHLDKVGEHLGRMVAKALKGSALSQKEVDALRMGAAVGIAYAAMALELEAVVDAPGIDAITIVQVAIAELEEVKKHG